MKKSILLIFLLFALNGCMGATALLGPTFTIFKTGNVAHSAVSFGTGYIVKSATGKTIGEHTMTYAKKNEKINNYLEKQKLRECEVIHTAALNSIFFNTLDELDCINNQSS